MTRAGDLLLLATRTLGLLIAATWMPPRLVRCLAAVAGLMFALDSKPDGTSAVESTRMLVGRGLSAAIALAAEGAVYLRGHCEKLTPGCIPGVSVGQPTQTSLEHPPAFAQRFVEKHGRSAVSTSPGRWC